MILSVIAIAAAYLLGSVSFSVLFARLFKGIDIRQHGSGNAGATNTLRVLGKGPAILVLALDICKGILAVWLGRWLAPDYEWTPALAGLAAVVGHNWPLYFHFRGGKGIATTIGMLSTLCFPPALCAGAIAILSIVLTRYVSLGSLLFVTLTPVFLVVYRLAGWHDYSNAVLIVGILIWALAVWRHRGNLVKLKNGTENKLGSKSGGKERSLG
ncbi:glycerol-3-phosphate 1-O-acyltransferase PlsY [Saccharibacillus sp. CPCC 101409]|uniref:glycerol-3-phosphate 1-O-acyltransferase PlsY n=1 Tax=Saccharibacillus sp. CPCC 101409 TaxID=3058041 RepID=UPI002671D62D|nr:glycerol-3-phosphate 1-O-acyltransferase PlsY [Saccharibacillus sp. CPCC 101409]MDO3409596.1 glycerol-3-phosphate 1-O-acyltransferase PlsY [Saccharibacillus sp. CPCC 101409]